MIYLQNQTPDHTAFRCEKERIAQLCNNSISVSPTKELYLVNCSEKAIDMYCDDAIYDGLSFLFEMALVDEEINTISYLTTLQYDSNPKSEIILKFLETTK